MSSDPHAATRADLGRPVEGAPDAPPLFVDEPFPPYRFVPGKAPHPFAHAEGYGHGAPRPAPEFLVAERWAESPSYLRGCDFFNRGWWWEAHEVWEELWHVVEGKDAQQHRLLKALIQLGACALNRERGVDGGAERLLATATGSLEVLVAELRGGGTAEDAATGEEVDAASAGDAFASGSSDAARFMGLDLTALRDEAQRRLAEPVERVSGFFLRPR